VWYLAELLFAEPPRPGRADDQCESCNVVFQAPDAAQAYRKAVAWGLSYAADPPSRMRLLGVSHLTTVGEELGDGTEIGGRSFQAAQVWERVSELVPPPEQLKAIRWEQARDTPLGELLGPDQVAQLRRAWGQAAAPGTSLRAAGGDE
jgi:hypothetical protein